MKSHSVPRRVQHGRDRGASLIMVMLILIVVSLLGIGGVQVSMMGERSARNDRDQQLAWQAAEAALVDAEFDMHGATASSGVASPRMAMFDGKNARIFENENGCGASGNSRGLCALAPAGKPAWLTAGFTDKSTSSNTVAFGTFTTRAFANGGLGIQPAQAPRYIIEPVIDPLGDMTGDQTLLYRVTAMGFGPRAEIQAVVQMLHRN